MKLPNIGLCGYMRSGKDTVADYLIAEHHYHRMGFAQALKVEVARGVGCAPGDLLKEPLKSQIRPVLQVWGTEFRRAVDENYWVDRAEEQIDVWQNVSSRRIVFTDVRFWNEINMLRGRGFMIIKIDMSVEDVLVYTEGQGEEREVTLARLRHRSETEWQQAEFDATIPSIRGDIDGLLTGIDTVIREYNERQ